MPLTKAKLTYAATAIPVPKTAVLPKRGAALPLPLLLPPELPLPPDEPASPVPVGLEVTLPVPCGPASAIKELHEPVGEAADWVLAEPLKSQADALLALF